MTETKEIQTVVRKFAKQDLIASKRYRYQSDILHAILDDKKSYSLEEVDKMINAFLTKKEVK